MHVQSTPRGPAGTMGLCAARKHLWNRLIAKTSWRTYSLLPSACQWKRFSKMFQALLELKVKFKFLQTQTEYVPILHLIGGKGQWLSDLFCLKNNVCCTPGCSCFRCQKCNVDHVDHRGADKSVRWLRWATDTTTVRRREASCPLICVSTSSISLNLWFVSVWVLQYLGGGRTKWGMK